MASGSNNSETRSQTLKKLKEALNEESVKVAADFADLEKTIDDEYLKLKLQRIRDVIDESGYCGSSAVEESSDMDNPYSICGAPYFKGPGPDFDTPPDNEDTILMRKLGMFDMTRCVAEAQAKMEEDDDELECTAEGTGEKPDDDTVTP